MYVLNYCIKIFFKHSQMFDHCVYIKFKFCEHKMLKLCYCDSQWSVNLSKTFPPCPLAIKQQNCWTLVCKIALTSSKIIWIISLNIVKTVSAPDENFNFHLLIMFASWMSICGILKCSDWISTVAKVLQSSCFYQLRILEHFLLDQVKRQLQGQAQMTVNTSDHWELTRRLRSKLDRMHSVIHWQWWCAQNVRWCAVYNTVPLH